MNRVIFLLLFPLILQAQIGLWRFKKVASISYGDQYAYTLCKDTDHNGSNEMVFAWWPPNHWEIWEHRPENQYQLVYADTGAYPYPPGITTGNFEPWDIGDIDQDSLTDLLGPNIDQPPDTPGIFYNVVTTQESPDYSSYPESLSWWYRYSNNEIQSAPFYFPPELDQDNLRELLFLAEGIGITHIFENRGNNQNELVWSKFQVGAWSFAFGDFDLDGRKEFVTANLASLGRVSIYENTGDNQYELVAVDTVRIPNGSDVFSGQDLDGDGKPEFFVCFAWFPGTVADFYLYMWEATGNNTYERILLANLQREVGLDWNAISKCGDIDGDGIEELVWSIGNKVMVYKATGNNQFQRVWEWYNNHGGTSALVNIYDMNQNGYNEIIISGWNKTSIFEIEAIKVLRPNGSENFQGNTKELIRWLTFNPPRCDSLSLFYSTDNGRTYYPIITGLPGTDTAYLWTVPNVNSDSCRIKIIAYGPGWQYDESDYTFRITAVGIEESRLGSLSYIKFEIQPNIFKSKTAIRFSLSAESKVSLLIYDVSGRKVRVLLEERLKPGYYNLLWDGKDQRGRDLSQGVYFYRLKTEGFEDIKKTVLLR